MNTLFAQLQRLYFLPEQQGRCQPLSGAVPGVAGETAALPFEVVAPCFGGYTEVSFDLVSPDGLVRAMVLGFKRAADWEHLAGLFQGLQDELALPEPAISVSGHAGYGLWFSLAAPVPRDEVAAFLGLLCGRFMPELSLEHLELCPSAADEAQVKLVPSLHSATGQWSAYIDPTLGGMFRDEPWLEMAPNMDKQADILAGLKSIKMEDFQRVMALLRVPGEASRTGLPGQVGSSAAAEFGAEFGAARDGERLSLGQSFPDPQSFLLAVMNAPAVSAHHRIEAAKALLPYFAPKAPQTSST